MAESVFKAFRKSQRKFKGIKVLFTENDEVLSNSNVYTSSDNIKYVSSNKYNSLVLPLLKKYLKLIVVSSERNSSVKYRCEKLGIEYFIRTGDKKQTIKNYVFQNNFNWNEIAYIGNDYSDPITINMYGYSFCTIYSPLKLQQLVDEIIPVNGRAGVLRAIFKKVL